MAMKPTHTKAAITKTSQISDVVKICWSVCRWRSVEISNQAPNMKPAPPDSHQGVWIFFDITETSAFAPNDNRKTDCFTDRGRTGRHSTRILEQCTLHHARSGTIVTQRNEVRQGLIDRLSSYRVSTA